MDTNTNTNRGFNHSRGRSSSSSRQNNYNVRGGRARGGNAKGRGRWQPQYRNNNNANVKSPPQYTTPLEGSGSRVTYSSRNEYGYRNRYENYRPGILGAYLHGHSHSQPGRSRAIRNSHGERVWASREEGPSPLFSSSSSSTDEATTLCEFPGSSDPELDSPTLIGAGGSGTMSVIMADTLLKNFRSLECDHCQRHFGFQARTARSRAEGVFCSSTCAENQLTACGGSGKENGPFELEARRQVITPTPKTTPSFGIGRVPTLPLISRGQAQSNGNANANALLLAPAPLRRQKAMPVNDKTADVNVNFNNDLVSGSDNNSNRNMLLPFHTPSLDTVAPNSRESARENETTSELFLKTESRNAKPRSSERSAIQNRQPFPNRVSRESRPSVFAATGLPLERADNYTSDIANMRDFDDETVPSVTHTPPIENEAKASPPNAAPLPLRPPIDEPSFTAPRRILLPTPPSTSAGPAPAPAAAKNSNTNANVKVNPVPVTPAVVSVLATTPTTSAPVSVDCVDRVSRNYVTPTTTPPPLAQVEEKKKNAAAVTSAPHAQVATAKDPAASAAKSPVTNAMNEGGASASAIDREEVTIYPARRVSKISKNLKWGRPLLLGMQLVVQRAHANSPLDIYVQTPDQSAQAGAMTTDFQNMLQEGQLNRQGLSYEVGSLCVAPYMGDHYRAEIVQNDPSSEFVRVFFSDFGNDEVVGKEQLYSLPAKYKDTPRLIYHCQWDLGATKEMSEHEKAEIYAKEVLEIIPINELRPGQYVIRIGAYRPRTKIRISREERPLAIASASVTSANVPESLASKKRPMITSLPVSGNIDTNMELGVVFTWSLTRYLIGSPKDDIKREEMHNKLNKAPETLTPYQGVPIVGEILIGGYQSELYRGLVKAVNGDEVTLDYIDYGDTSVLKINDCFSPPEEILTYPRYGVNVNLDTTRIKKLVRMVTKPIEDQMYKLMTVEFTTMNKDRPDEFNAIFWINPQQTFNSFFEERIIED